MTPFGACYFFFIEVSSSLGYKHELAFFFWDLPPKL